MSVKDSNERPVDVENIIKELKEEGYTIIQSMKYLVDEKGYSLAEAKKLVSSHPDWSATVSAAQPLHDDICSVLVANKRDGADR